MSAWWIEVRDDAGAVPLSVRVEAPARDLALELALAVLRTVKHHPSSSGATLTLRVLA